jgi:hypothetical protein
VWPMLLRHAAIPKVNNSMSCCRSVLHLHSTVQSGPVASFDDVWRAVRLCTAATAACQLAPSTINWWRLQNTAVAPVSYACVKLLFGRLLTVCCLAASVFVLVATDAAGRHELFVLSNSEASGTTCSLQGSVFQAAPATEPFCCCRSSG